MSTEKEGEGMKNVTIDLGYRKATGHYHSNGGGFVESTATVDATVYVGKDARISGTARVSGTAKIVRRAMKKKDKTDRGGGDIKRNNDTQ